MIQIDKNKKTVSITLNTQFYPKEKIEKAAKDFSEVCKIRIEKNIKSNSIVKKAFLMSNEQNSLKVSITPKQKNIDLNTIGYVFCNYLLAEIKSG